MKKIIALTMALVLCCVMVSPVMATEFVSSITDKGAPELVTTVDEDGNVVIGQLVDEDGNVVGVLHEDCLVVTALYEVHFSDLIPEEAKELLLHVYQELKVDDMVIPYEKFNANLNPDNMVIRDLFDVSWLCLDHPEVVAPKGVSVKLTFKLGVSADTDVYVASYKNDHWNPIIDSVNNGDGTLTCVFEDFCPVSFSVAMGSDTPPSQTGDTADLTLWIVLMAVSAVALGAVLVMGKKKAV